MIIAMLPGPVIIRGAGDLASGTAHRLWNSGFAVIMLELPEPLVLRRSVAFASAVFNGMAEVEGVKAEICADITKAISVLKKGFIPLLIDPEGSSLQELRPPVVVDATLAKSNLITGLADAELVIGLGPGFTAGLDVHAVIETERGHNLGRVIYSGSAAPDSGVPGAVHGFGKERLLRAPVDGVFTPLKEIGDLVAAAEPVATIDNVDVRSNIDGMVRGLLHPGLKVRSGLKIGDIDPRGVNANPRRISDKARSIGGGVLEAIMHKYFFNR